ncbi:hypothetical protein B0H67DRAFT_647629 [Lasiosphaeris hirsuta]|uniref:Uncharacterized protein n=1 Tax=Lasiosphaeris hirsuta TaxID=260670 RepID=A0AA40A1C8_9PEZI|nr:hypothetical protein B0H67DRAFT_647629 [Lasiosphaeris hirsuta]
MALRSRDIERISAVLQSLANDGHRLNGEREWFENPPEPSPPGIATRGPSLTPLPPDEQEKMDHATRMFQLTERASLARPFHQFRHEVLLEQHRIWRAEEDKPLNTMTPNYRQDEARKVVKARWIEQGIWSRRWKTEAGDTWKHESKKEFAASRPFYRFSYELERERHALLAEEAEIVPDINTRAYNRVKQRWIEIGYWNEAWGVLPGMSWLYEDLPDNNNPPVAASLSQGNETGEKGGRAAESTAARRNKPPAKKRAKGLATQDRGEQRQSPRLVAREASHRARGKTGQASSNVTKKLVNNKAKRVRSGGQ